MVILYLMTNSVTIRIKKTSIEMSIFIHHETICAWSGQCFGFYWRWWISSSKVMKIWTQIHPNVKWKLENSLIKLYQVNRWPWRSWKIQINIPSTTTNALPLSRKLSSVLIQYFPFFCKHFPAKWKILTWVYERTIKKKKREKLMKTRYYCLISMISKQILETFNSANSYVMCHTTHKEPKFPRCHVS